mgnify:CR=1 FL=1
MKKFFTLIAAVAMAASVNAQTITFEKAAAGSVPASIAKDGLVLTLTDPENKISVDENTAYFGTADSPIKLTRLKTGGKSTTQKNYLTLTVPSDGTLKVYARTGKNADTNRNIVLTQDGTQLINKKLLESEAVKATIEGETEQKNVYPVVSVAVKKGDVLITYPTQGINIYGIELATATGISSISATEAKAKTATFNLASQQVSKSYKGIVVKNGKKYLNK